MQINLRAVFLIIFTCLAVVLIAQPETSPGKADFERRSRQEKIGSRYIPADLPDAMKTLESLTSQQSQASYASKSEDFVVERLFFSFGRWIAINWGLYDGSRFSRYLRNLGVDQPDGQIEFIMRAYHRYLNDIDINVAQLATAYKTEKALQDSIRRSGGTVIDQFVRPAKSANLDSIRID